MHYTVTIANTGETVYTGATVTDALAGVLDDAVYQNDATASTGTVAYAAPVLTWTGDLAVGEIATVTYSVAVTYPASGDRVMDNAVTSAEPGSTCPAPGTDPGCAATVTIIVPALTVTMTSDTNGAVVAGGTVNYTIVATNTGEAPMPRRRSAPCWRECSTTPRTTRTRPPPAALSPSRAPPWAGRVRCP
ncbi:hypothetical protein ACFQX6_35075 [Streptosporangium lutulentum]